MSGRIEWPAATADLFTEAAGIAAYIDGEGTDPATATADYRREMAELEQFARTDHQARHELDETLAAQRGAVTAWLDALVHLGVARWERFVDDENPTKLQHRLVIRGPVEDAGP
jgi:hypothetical protein